MRELKVTPTKNMEVYLNTKTIFFLKEFLEIFEKHKEKVQSNQLEVLELQQKVLLRVVQQKLLRSSQKYYQK